MQQIQKYLQDQSSQFEDDLFQLLRIPNVSADNKYQDSVRQAVRWMLDHFHSLELSAEIIETDAHPIAPAQSPPAEGLCAIAATI